MIVTKQNMAKVYAQNHTSKNTHKFQKFGIFALFGSGWICTLFATLRFVQVSVKDGVPMIPDPKWLEMWTDIETSMGTTSIIKQLAYIQIIGATAVMIECAPAFNALRSRRSNNKVRKPVVLLEMRHQKAAALNN
ncbi:hypothetical protein CFE70_000050 [Pyrenophora teres f. teres 0-1]